MESTAWKSSNWWVRCPLALIHFTLEELAMIRICWSYDWASWERSGCLRFQSCSSRCHDWCNSWPFSVQDCWWSFGFAASRCWHSTSFPCCKASGSCLGSQRRSLCTFEPGLWFPDHQSIACLSSCRLWNSGRASAFAAPGCWFLLCGRSSVVVVKPFGFLQICCLGLIDLMMVFEESDFDLAHCWRLLLVHLVSFGLFGSGDCGLWLLSAQLRIASHLS